jgi:RNA polymerase primary sigma factor
MMYPRPRGSLNSTPFLQIYLRDISGTPLLSHQEERELADRVAMGDAIARDRMVEAHLRLVVKIARRYSGQGVDLEDLIADGNLGLIRAVESFDGTMDARLSTYAMYWVEESIRRAVMNSGRLIRVPANMLSLLRKWRRATAALADRLGHAPTPEEVGKSLRLSKKRIGTVVKAIRANTLTRHSNEFDEDAPTLNHADSRSEGPDSQMTAADDLAHVCMHLDALEEREAAVIRMRFGLEPHKPMTLHEVGERLGLTRERIRQVEGRAIQKLIRAARRRPRSVVELRPVVFGAQDGQSTNLTPKL